MLPKLYRVRLKSDTGPRSIITSATSREAAIKAVCTAEGAPESSVYCAERYTRKTRDIYVVQQYYPAYGWEDVCQSYNRKEALTDLKAYRDNDPRNPARMIKRRERIEENAH